MIGAAGRNYGTFTESGAGGTKRTREKRTREIGRSPGNTGVVRQTRSRLSLVAFPGRGRFLSGFVFVRLSPSWSTQTVFPVRVSGRPLPTVRDRRLGNERDENRSAKSLFCSPPFTFINGTYGRTRYSTATSLLQSNEITDVRLFSIFRSYATTNRNRRGNYAYYTCCSRDLLCAFYVRPFSANGRNERNKFVHPTREIPTRKRYSGFNEVLLPIRNDLRYATINSSVRQTFSPITNISLRPCK